MASAIDVILAAVPWLPRELALIYAQTYIETGDPDLAKQAMRQDASYDTYFAGNRRPDGSIMYEEEIYLGITEAFDDALLSINLNPDLFRQRYGELIAGLVSPTEFADRLDEVYDRVLTAAGPIREYYAQTYGLDLSDEAIVASVLDPDIGDRVIEQRIAVSEIGGQARLHDFGIDLDLATRLEQTGITSAEAGQVFAEAAASVPVLDVLARRHNDPDDDFDLNEFLSASIFGDPDERRRLRRLLAQERSMFSGPTGFSTTGRAITGLSPI